MYITHLFVLLFISFVSCVYQGVAIAGNKPDGSSLSQSDWTAVFTQLQSWGFNSARLFASTSSAGNILSLALPAAMSLSNFTILAGVWASGGIFETEKEALLSAVGTYGHTALAGVGVGSEDLYRGDLTPAVLAGYINETRAGLRGLGANTWVGCIDTWTSWVNASNYDVIVACDFVGADAYPYWQAVDISAASATFFGAYQATIAAVKAATPWSPRWIWMTETGWPSGGEVNGSAVPSLANSASYWSTVGCALKNQNIDFFWYSNLDPDSIGPGVQAAEQYFGLAYNNGTLKYSLSC